MTQDSASSTVQEVKPQKTMDTAPTSEGHRASKEEALEFLKEIQENAGQISELVIEEENLVNDFFDFVLKILKPFGKTLEISISSLPENYSVRLSKAYLYVTGQLVLVYRNGEVEILNLADQENREILVEITGEIMLKLKTVINSYKSKTEKRVQFLMAITKELQKVAKVFSEDTPKVKP